MHPPAVHLPRSGPPLPSSSNPYSLFEIRLERDFIVFWGSQYESTDQVLKGVLVLCLQSPLRLEEISLHLDGILRLSWSDPGVLGHKSSVLDYKWPPFVGTQGKSTTLPPGNYEWPFEYIFPHDTPESVEGIPEASIIYSLKATITRGKLARHLHTRKQVRIIRTLLPSALEFMHTMSIENTWVNKLDYLVALPTKAAVFGGTAKLEMRFIPLIKGLELGKITVTMTEIRECHVESRHGLITRELRTERTVSAWEFDVSREQDWHDGAEDVSQEGWIMTKNLELPRRLRKCIQDLDIPGISVRHKIRVHIPIHNPDGHISELEMALPIHIFISPNMPLDEQGNLVEQISDLPNQATDVTVPPEYGEHVLDQLYEDIGRSPSPRTELDSNVSTCERLDPNTQQDLLPTLSQSEHRDVADTSQRSSGVIDRPIRNSSEHPGLDSNDLSELSKVPTYRTALRSPVRSHAQPGNIQLPDYETVTGNHGG